MFTRALYGRSRFSFFADSFECARARFPRMRGHIPRESYFDLIAVIKLYRPLRTEDDIRTCRSLYPS